MDERGENKFCVEVCNLTVAAPTYHPNLCQRQGGSCSPTAAEKADLYNLLVADSEVPTGSSMSSSGWTCWTGHKWVAAIKAVILISCSWCLPNREFYLAETQSCFTKGSGQAGVVLCCHISPEVVFCI